MNCKLIKKLTIIILCNIALVADADDSNNKIYGKVNVGLFKLKDANTASLNNNIIKGHRSIAADLALGYYFIDNTRLEISLNVPFTPKYRSSVYNDSNTNLELQHSNKPKIYAFLLSGYIDLFEPLDKFKIFAGAGIGVSRLQDNIKITGNNNTIYLNAIGKSKTNLNLVYQGTAGVSYSLNNKIDLEIAYRYINYGNFQKLKTLNYSILNKTTGAIRNTTREYIYKANAHISHNFLAGLKYKF